MTAPKMFIGMCINFHGMCMVSSHLECSFAFTQTVFTDISECLNTDSDPLATISQTTKRLDEGWPQRMNY